MARRKKQPEAPRPAHSHIRWMIRRDMPEVLAIEEDRFEYPWNEDEFVRCLRQRNCIGMVVDYLDEGWQPQDIGTIAGFMVYELHKTRLELLAFAVNRDFERRGFGRLMVEKLIGKLSPDRRCRISTEIRESNLPAQLFFKAMGFRAVSVLRDYYEQLGFPSEDAYVFQYRLSASRMQEMRAMYAEADAR